MCIKIIHVPECKKQTVFEYSEQKLQDTLDLGSETGIIFK